MEMLNIYKSRQQRHPPLAIVKQWWLSHTVPKTHFPLPAPHFYPPDTLTSEWRSSSPGHTQLKWAPSAGGETRGRGEERGKWGCWPKSVRTPIAWSQWKPTRGRTQPNRDWRPLSLDGDAVTRYLGLTESIPKNLHQIWGATKIPHLITPSWYTCSEDGES